MTGTPRPPTPTNPFAPRRPDAELISAYLDDQLSAAEKEALELRLADDPALRADLEALREAVIVLRAAPELEVPRSFRLDPARFGGRTRWWARYGVLRVAGLAGTAAAALMIALGLLFAMPQQYAPSGTGAVALQATLTTTTDTGKTAGAAENELDTLTALPTEVVSTLQGFAATSPAPAALSTGTPLPTQTQAAKRETTEAAASGGEGPAPSLLAEMSATPVTGLGALTGTPMPAPMGALPMETTAAAERVETQATEDAPGGGIGRTDKTAEGSDGMFAMPTPSSTATGTPAQTQRIAATAAPSVPGTPTFAAQQPPVSAATATTVADLVRVPGTPTPPATLVFAVSEALVDSGLSAPARLLLVAGISLGVVSGVIVLIIRLRGRM